MARAKKRIADRVNLSTVHFDRGARSKLVDKPIVSFSPSSGLLFFNPKMTELLKITNWKQVIIGYDRSSGIIVLKKCDVEEYGGIMIRTPSILRGRGRKSIERIKKCRIINIQHLVKSSGLTMPRYYRAELNGAMILLEAINKS